jgi:hypothetical protein
MDDLPDFMVRKDTDQRWNKFPGVTVEIQGGCDIRSDDQHWNFRATREDGAFMIGTGYKRISSARARCYKKLMQNAEWQIPTPKRPNMKRAEVVGPIGQPEGELADFLARWTAENG